MDNENQSEIDKSDVQIRTALISVFDKAGVVPFAQRLSKLGVSIISTGGTAKQLKEAGIPVIPIEEIGHFPEMLGGRVKTLQPEIHAGILARRTVEEHMKQISEKNVRLIDMVVCNLYPFNTVASNPDSTEIEIVEMIDIGGPTMVRACGKNYESDCIVPSSEFYDEVIEEMERTNGNLSFKTRRKMAVKAFGIITQYDALIHATLLQRFPPEETGARPLPNQIAIVEINGTDIKTTYYEGHPTRYGENWDQKGAIFTRFGSELSKQLRGKQLSYNNEADMSSALSLVEELDRNLPLLKRFGENRGHVVVIIKHRSPCGYALGSTQTEAYLNALKADPTSAFGGVIASNLPFTKDTIEEIEKQGQFVECIIAPGFEEGAKLGLEKKKSVRFVDAGPLWGERSSWARELEIKSLPGGRLLVQNYDWRTWSEKQDKDKPWTVVTTRQPTDSESASWTLAWIGAKYEISNSVAYAKDGMLLGICGGQPNRVDSARFAAIRASRYGLNLRDASSATDSFWPFPDGIDVLAELGVTANINPGGSVNDDKVKDAADKNNIAMAFTGKRVFKH